MFILFSYLFSYDFDNTVDQNPKVNVYNQLIDYQKSKSHFEISLNNNYRIYVSQIIDLTSDLVTVNILADRRLGLNRSIQSFIRLDFENAYPKLIRKINLEDIVAFHEPIPVSTFFNNGFNNNSIIIIPIVTFTILFLRILF